MMSTDKETVSLVLKQTPRHKDIRDSVGVLQTFLTSTLNEGDWSVSRPLRFSPEESVPGTH
jgi:hypothetical protein